MKKKNKRRLFLFAIFVVIIAAGIAGLSVKKKHTSPSNPSFPDSKTIGTGGVFYYDAERETSDISDDSSFIIHFFDVGEGDSTLVECDGHYMLIDGGNPSYSSFLYSYLEKRDIKYIDYIVCTHEHEDHVGGLAGALNYASVGLAYAPVTESETKAFNSFIKYLDAQGKSLTVPKAGEIFSLGSATVQIVGPIDMSLAEDNINNSSIVLHIKYGSTSFLITGDAEEAEELSIVESHFDIKSNVMKIGHHGSYTSTTDAFIKAIDPEYCIISVGEDNAYGHPHDEVMDRIEKYGAQIYRTDLNGEITCISDVKEISMYFEGHNHDRTNESENYNKDSRMGE